MFLYLEHLLCTMKLTFKNFNTIYRLSGYWSVFKDGGKEEKKKNPTSSVKCYFVFMESSALSGKTVHEARCIFMHAHMVSSVAKYMARLVIPRTSFWRSYSSVFLLQFGSNILIWEFRFSLILSKTVKLDVDLSTVNIQRIDDEPGRV